MLSPGLWRSFFKPRYEILMRPIRAAGVHVFFHSCGQVRRLLDDFADLQVDAVWPQLNLYDFTDLARRCRDARIAIALHPDRGDLMTRGTPGQVRAAVHQLAETFRVADGGAWFYVEIDSGFPFANIEALVESIAALRVQ
jgi:hypothetical protein